MAEILGLEFLASLLDGVSPHAKSTQVLRGVSRNGGPTVCTPKD